MKKTTLMVTNLVHLRTAITQSCVPEVFSRMRQSSKGGGGGNGPAPGEKRPERCSGRRIRLCFMSVITFCSSTASVTNFSKQCSRRSNGKVYSSLFLLSSSDILLHSKAINPRSHGTSGYFLNRCSLRPQAYFRSSLLSLRKRTIPFYGATFSQCRRVMDRGYDTSST